VLLASTLAACTSSGQDELQVWMQTERNSIKPSVQPIPEPTKFVPQAYLGERQLPPFSEEKLASVLRGAQPSPVANSGLIEPELNRRKQPLEAHPLDAMVMVGSLNRDGKLVALVKVDSLLYTRISETEVVMREIVQDSAGEWIERAAALQLQEGASK